MNKQVLVVDDDKDLCELLSMGLEQRGYSTRTVHTVEDAEAAMREGSFWATLCDVYLGSQDGLELCARATANYPQMSIIMMTGQGDLEVAIRAIRAGAYDFIPKPVKLDSVAMTLARADELRALRETVQRLQTESRRVHNDMIMGESRPMKRVFELITTVAPGEATVLITGESGTGKELVARSIHDQSKRSKGPFVAINCAAMTPTLLESELFGHMKGSFTDANRDRSGLFVQASGGTLFLDEVGEMALEMQAKLLRVLQENKVRPVGGDKEIPFDTRIVAATNRDLETEIEEGRFREDLFYRIHVVGISLPPLRTRGNDILKLAQHFVVEQAKRIGKSVVGVSSPVAQKLLAYDWPGNVRELQNAIEHAVTLTQHDNLVPQDLPSKVRDFHSSKIVVDTANPDEMPTLEEMERRYVRRVLDAVQGNKTQAARVLGVNRRTMYRKIERLGLESDS